MCHGFMINLVKPHIQGTGNGGRPEAMVDGESAVSLFGKKGASGGSWMAHTCFGGVAGSKADGDYRSELVRDIP
jgi:hypothetical protein